MIAKKIFNSTKNPSIELALVVLILLSLLFTRAFNITTFLDLSKVNDFVDIVVTLGDIIVFFLAIKYIFQLKAKCILVVVVLASLPFLIRINTVTPANIFHWGVVFSRLILWVAAFYQLLKAKISQSSKKSLVMILIFVGFFDHYLLSSSIPVLSIFVSIYLLYNYQNLKKYNKKILRAFYFILILNTLVALYQIIVGKSLGLHFLGEKYIDINMIGVAKQNFFGSTSLRGYGLMSHPNILGFVGVVVLWFYHAFKSINPIINKAFSRDSIILILISFSRTAIFCFLIGVVEGLVSKKSSTKIFAIAVLAFIILIFSSRLGSSDNYRVQDTRRFIATYSQSRTIDKLFGVGLGQYSFYLQDNYELENWQYQPVHNVFLQIWFEVGLIPILITIFGAYMKIDRLTLH